MSDRLTSISPANSDVAYSSAALVDGIGRIRRSGTTKPTPLKTTSALTFCLIALIYIVSFTLLADTLHSQHGFPLDDSYIHQTVARNFAQHGTLGFITGRRSSGTTSLLWTFIQAINFKFLGPIDPVWYNLGLSYLLLLCIGPLLFLLALQDHLPLETCYVLAVCPALMGNFLWLGMIGMEHLLFIVLSLAAIYFWFQPTPSSHWSALASGCAAGLLTITRPEAAVFGPLLVFGSYYATKVRRSRQDMVTVLSLWASFCCVMFAANIWTSSSLMPATLKGRSWLYFHATGGPHSLHSTLRFCGNWIQRLPRQFSAGFTQQMISVQDIRGWAAIFGVALLALTMAGAFSLVRTFPIRISFLLSWAAVHFLTYLATFPSAGHGGRYQPLCLMLFSPLLFLGARFVLSKVFRPDNHRIFVALCLSMFFAGFCSLLTWRKVTSVGIAHINETHGRIAIWMNDHVPATARFAAFDIGRISYDWRGQVVDLGGLVDPDYLHYLQQGKVPEYLHERHIEYLMLPDTIAVDLGFERKIRMQKLVEYCSSHDDWLLGFRYTIHATQCQELYQFDENQDF